MCSRKGRRRIGSRIAPAYPVFDLIGFSVMASLEALMTWTFTAETAPTPEIMAILLEGEQVYVRKLDRLIAHCIL
jgi:hypothetical protein